jgi:hypothetical protein
MDASAAPISGADTGRWRPRSRVIASPSSARNEPFAFGKLGHGLHLAQHKRT